MIVYPGEKIQVLEPDEKTKAMMAWAQSIGVRISPKLKYPALFSPGYLGVQTIEAIEPGEDLLHAPNISMLSSKLMNPPELLQIYAAHPSLFSLPEKSHEDNRMIVFMLYEQSKDSQSFWKPYLDFLPKDVETIIDWSDEDLENLQDPDFEYDSKFRRDRDNKGNLELGQILLQYPIFDQKFLTLENINWVWKILCTRSYGRCVPYNSLIPLADLFNHSNVNTNYFYSVESEKCPDFDSEELKVDLEDTDDALVEKTKPVVLASLKLHRLCFAAFTEQNEELKEKADEILQQARLVDSQSFVKSNFYVEMNAAYKAAQYGSAAEDENSFFRISCSKFERYEAGAQVFIAYGKYSNRQLLTNYGFALEKNVYNYARIQIKLGSMINSQQAQALTGGFKIDSGVLFKLKMHEFALDLLKVIRCFMWTQDLSANAFLHPSDYSQEIRVLEKFQQTLLDYYSSYKTTLEQDLEILPNVSGKTYLAVLYRKGNKEIILQQIQYAQIAENILKKVLDGNSFDIVDQEIESLSCKSKVSITKSALSEYFEDLKEFFIKI